MTDLHSCARGGPARRWSWYSAGVGLALLASGCLNDGTGTGPSTGAARLAVAANVAGTAGSAAAVTGLGVEVRYLTSAGSNPLLLQQTIPLASVAAGGVVKQPLSVDLAACLGDPLHLPGAGECSVVVRVTLLAGNTSLDVVNIGPLTLRPGETSDPAEVTLHTVGTLSVTPGTPGTLFPGGELQLTATLTDAAGGAVEGRTIQWTSNATSVATVDGGGKVTAVAPGNAIITASGGDRTTAVTVRVVQRASILLDRESLGFDGRQKGPPPAGQQVNVVNGATGVLDGLAVGDISYSGGATGWLAATLSSSTAPASLVLRPSTTDLAPGSYTATVPLTAPTASNSGVTVQVSYTVTAATLLAVDRRLVEITGTPWDSLTASVEVTAGGPLSGLAITDVTYSRFASGWLSAELTSPSAPSTLRLGLSGFVYPGVYQANVTVSAPGAASDALVKVLWTVPSDGFYFYLDPSPECVYVDPEFPSSDTLYVGAGLSVGEGTLGGVPVIVRALGPGLTLLSDTIYTYNNSIRAVRTPGFTGEVKLEGSLGLPPRAPGSLTDTVTVRFQDEDYYGCYEEGQADLTAPYVPGAPVLRRAPGTRPSVSPASRPTTPPAREATPASAAPASTVRSRFTPELH